MTTFPSTSTLTNLIVRRIGHWKKEISQTNDFNLIRWDCSTCCPTILSRSESPVSMTQYFLASVYHVTYLMVKVCTTSPKDTEISLLVNRSKLTMPPDTTLPLSKIPEKDTKFPLPKRIEIDGIPFLQPNKKLLTESDHGYTMLGMRLEEWLVPSGDFPISWKRSSSIIQATPANYASPTSPDLGRRESGSTLVIFVTSLNITSWVLRLSDCRLFCIRRLR